MPQWYSVNGGVYRRLDSGARSCLKEPGAAILHYKIRVRYPGPLVLGPATFHTDVRVATTGHPAKAIEPTIPNRALGPAEYRLIRGRLNAALDTAGCTA
ncbi:hypothetical protein [Actinomadura sp. NPDC049753]|uniref:hypothetical protein n=1 Tax=Actinomadura sp. NPDC049753 TaxID=3154739 RepID=UPI00344367B7